MAAARAEAVETGVEVVERAVLQENKLVGAGGESRGHHRPDELPAQAHHGDRGPLRILDLKSGLEGTLIKGTQDRRGRLGRDG